MGWVPEESNWRRTNCHPAETEGLKPAGTMAPIFNACRLSAPQRIRTPLSLSAHARSILHYVQDFVGTSLAQTTRKDFDAEAIFVGQVSRLPNLAGTITKART